jgi:hypothetical protein
MVFIEKPGHPPSPPQGGNLKVDIPKSITLVPARELKNCFFI